MCSFVPQSLDIEVDLSWIYKFLTARQLFSQHEGDITIRKSDSRTIFMKMKPHELDKFPSRYLNWGNCMFGPSSW